MINPRMRITAPLLATLALLLLSTAVRADLLITPTRVVLDDRSRSAVVTLMNRSTRTRTYRIEWIEQKMTSEGDYVPIEAPQASDAIASPMLRHSPRRVTIAPGEYQKVRINLRKPKDLAAGEYRSHMLFRVEPDKGAASSGDAPEKGASLQVQVNLSFSIPVIVRHGRGPTTASIAGVGVQPGRNGGNELVVDIKREGNYSPFGRISAYLQDPSGNEERIGLLNNVAVFMETPQRRLHIPLQRSNFPAGSRLRVSYEGDDEYEGRMWDQKAFQVGR